MGHRHRASPLLRLRVLGADTLQEMLGMPVALLRYAGLSLVPFIAYLAYLATRERASQGGVWAVIEINAAWVAASVLLLLSGRIALTGLGSAFVLAQAIAVAGFALLQYVGPPKAGGGLRKSAQSIA